jgi:putative copper resistance protein D
VSSTRTGARASRGIASWTWLFVFLVVVAGAIAVTTAVAAGSFVYRELDREYPGQLTAVASTSLGTIVVLASTVCIGGLFYAAFLRAPIGKNRFAVDNAVDLSVVRWGAGVWAAAAAALIAVDAADSNGVALAGLLRPGALGYLFQASYPPGAWLVTTVCAFIVLCAAFVIRRWETTVLMLAIGMVGVLAPVLVGQVLVGPNHDFGGDATILGLPALVIWFGSSVGVAARVLGHKPLSATTLRRYALTSVTCGAIWAGALVVIALFEMAGTPWLANPTGGFFVAQFLILAVMAITGAWAARRYRRSQSAAAPGTVSTRALRPWAIITLVMIALYLGVDVAMQRIPPPQYFVPTTIMDLFFGYNVDGAPTLAHLLLDWRINILFFVPFVAAIVLYLLGVRRLRRRGDKWPLGRTITWILGCVVVILTTSSALGPYASASFSMHMIFHMSLNMLGPLLLVMGGPITLALRATPATNATRPAGPHEWINTMLHWSLTRKLYNPLLVFVEFVGSYYLIYFTPIFDWAMRYHWAHQLMNLHFLIVGYLFYGLVTGVDRPPRPLPYIGKLGLVLAAMPFHAFFGVIVMTDQSIIADQLYRYLRVPWMHNLHSDQVLAGGIAWAAGELPLIVVVVALITQWSRQDQKEAAQQDRHLDSGLDGSFDAYNAMLAKLAERPDAGPSLGRAETEDTASRSSPAEGQPQGPHEASRGARVPD